MADHRYVIFEAECHSLCLTNKKKFDLRQSLPLLDSLLIKTQVESTWLRLFVLRPEDEKKRKTAKIGSIDHFSLSITTTKTSITQNSLKKENRKLYKISDQSFGQRNIQRFSSPVSSVGTITVCCLDFFLFRPSFIAALTSSSSVSLRPGWLWGSISGDRVRWSRLSTPAFSNRPMKLWMYSLLRSSQRSMNVFDSSS